MLTKQLTAFQAPGGYPHTYNNYEGFSFGVSGPYLEFPMLESGVYTGGASLLTYILTHLPDSKEKF